LLHTIYGHLIFQGETMGILRALFSLLTGGAGKAGGGGEGGGCANGMCGNAAQASNEDYAGGSGAANFRGGGGCANGMCCRGGSCGCCG
jgi:hypothetical protein